MNILELVAGISVDSSGMDEDLENLATRAVAKGKLIADAIGTVASKGFSLLKNAISSSVETGKSFDTAVSQIAATTGQTVDQIQDLKAAAQEMGATTKFTATEAAEGINILAMAGMSASDILEEDASGATLLSTTLSLASAGAMSMESSATYLTASLKGFSSEGKSAAYYADLMAKGATLANTDVSGLGEALSGVAATASSYGQASDSVTLSLLKLAEANVTGSNASTSLKAAMKDLYTPTDTAAVALNELGVSAYNADGSARDFNDVVDSLSGALGGMSAQQKNAYLNTIFGIQGLDAYNKMAGVSTEKTNSFKEALANASGSAAEQAATQLDNLEGSMTLLDSAMDGLKLAFYSMFSDKLKSAIDLISDSVTILTEGLSSGGLLGMIKSLGSVADNAFQKMLKSLSGVTKLPLVSWFNQIKKAGSEAFSGVVNAISDLLKVFDPVVQAIKDFIGVSEDNRTEMQKNIDKMSAAKAIFEAIKGTIEITGTVISTAISLVTDALQKVIEDAQTDGTLINEIITGIQTVIDTAFAFISDAWNNVLLPVFTEIITWLSENIQPIFETTFTTIQTVIETVFSAAQAMVETTFTYISELWNGILLPVFTEIYAWLVENVQPTFETVFAAVQSVVETVFTAIQTVWNDVLSPAFSSISDTITNNLQPTFETAWGAIYSVIETVFNGIQTIWTTILEPVFTALLESVRDNIEPLFNTTFEAIKGYVETAFQGIADTWENHLKPCFDAIANFIKNTLIPAFNSVVSKVRDSVQPIFQKLGDFLKTTLKPTFDSVFKSISSVVKVAFAAISSAYKTVLKPLFDGMIDFIKNVFTGNWKGAWQSIVNTFGTVFNGIIATAKIPINAVIGLINKAIGFVQSGLNAVIGAMNKVSVTIPDWVPGIGGGTFGISIPTVSFGTIPQLEEGGILRKGQKGYLEGAGDEAVVPLEKSDGWLSALAEKINENRASEQPIIININGYDKNKEDLANEIADALSKRMADDYSRQRRVFA